MLAADVALSGQMPPLGFTGGETGSISGSVFAATASDACSAHDAAHGMDQVQVQLLDQTGTVVAETTTDESGAYQFDELIPGEYSVRTVAIAGEAMLAAQQLDQIGVQSGVAMTDYDFCHFEAAEPSNVALDESRSALASVLAFAARDQSSPTSTVSDSTFAFVAPMTGSVALPSLESTTSSTEIFGGSSRSLKNSGSIKSWDDLQWGDWPVDTLFSTIQFLDVTGADSVGLATLDSIYGQAEGTSHEFADRYTSESLEWCDCEDEIEVQDVLGLGDSLPDAVDMVAEQTIDVPQVASRTSAATNQ